MTSRPLDALPAVVSADLLSQRWSHRRSDATLGTSDLIELPVGLGADDLGVFGAVHTVRLFGWNRTGSIVYRPSSHVKIISPMSASVPGMYDFT